MVVFSLITTNDETLEYDATFYMFKGQQPFGCLITHRPTTELGVGVMLSKLLKWYKKIIKVSHNII